MTCKKLSDQKLCWQEIDPQLFDFLINRYNGLSKEISFAKVRQWLAMIATIGFYGIILNVYVDHLAIFMKFYNIIIIGSILVWIASLLYLISCHVSLCRNGERMKIVLGQFKAEHGIEKIINKGMLCPNISCLIPWIFYSIITMGVLLIILIANCGA